MLTEEELYEVQNVKTEKEYLEEINVTQKHNDTVRVNRMGFKV